MVSQAENELLTRVGPGTPMGAVLRRYWMTALLSEELPAPDCAPVRVRLLGEDLIAFRDTEGRVGLLGDHCAHRGASLFFGRNEESGLRCVYHGWKYDADGACVDMPNEPPESNFKHKIRHLAYPCAEAGGLIWAYMGPDDKQPPLPGLEWLDLPAGHRFVSKTFEDCNYLQGLEGGVDSSHSSFLHRRMGATPQATLGYRARSTAPKLQVLDTDYGYMYASIRDLPDEDRTYVRVYQFAMPFHQMRAFEGWFGIPLIQGHIWVPIDDEHQWVYNWMYARDGSALPEEGVRETEIGFGRGPDHMLPGYRLKANRSNDYGLDRGAQRTDSFTGIAGTNTQDMAIQETMGAIYDRSQEHLGSSDLAVIAARRLLLQAARDVAAGRDPLGVAGTSRNARPAEIVIPRGASWQEALREDLVARW